MNYPILPSFIEDIDYKELSPLDGEYSYRFTTKKDIVIYFTNRIIPKGQELTFSDNKNRVWLTIRDNQITISKDYAWDGCTPKKWWGGWWGTPDFEKTKLASLVHDVLLQFHQTDHFPLSRYEIDNMFKNILHQKGFIFEDIYYIGVRINSNLPHKKNNNVYSELTITTKY
jgi:hypothetical protein